MAVLMLELILLVAAFVCFTIASFVSVGRVNLMAAGLALLVLAAWLLPKV